MSEYAVRFGEEGRLVGIVTTPPATRGRCVGVVLINAGLIHRVGPKRLYVRLARTLASLGFFVLRFDLSGIGDSDYPRDDASPEESVRRDVRQAMDFLGRDRGLKEFALVGICAGAVIAFVLACEEPRVVAVGLIDPTDFGASVLADASASAETRASNYFRSVSSKGLTMKTLARFLSGRSDYSRAIASLWTRLRTLARGDRTSEAARHYVASRIGSVVDQGTHLLLVYTERGDSLDYVRIAFGHERNIPGLDDLVTFRLIGSADHDFTLPSVQEELLAIVGEWSSRLDKIPATLSVSSTDTSAT